MSNKKGEKFEEYAYHYLLSKGLKLVDKNFICKVGEIDLIMQDKDTRVFVEVRYRDRDRYGDSAETITRSKQRKLINSAKYYLQINKLTEKIPCRFDVVALSSDEPINWIQDAFQVRY